MDGTSSAPRIGRCSLQCLYQQLLDLVMYVARGAEEETDNCGQTRVRLLQDIA